MSDNKETTETEQETPACFVIMPFSDPDGYEKDHFKKVYEQIFKPAIEAAGFVAHRVDEDSASTLIQAKIFKQLIDAPMVLCDLSAKNPNVLYELGIRHAFDKPVVLVQEVGQSHIFDIVGVSTTNYRKARCYDEVLDDRKRITDALIKTADDQNNYSFMKLVNMMSATTKDCSGQITSEERIEIMLLDLVQKVNRILNLDEISDLKRNIEFFPVRLLSEIYNAERLISQAKLDKSSVTMHELSNVYVSINHALQQYKACICTSDEVTERAIACKDDLLNILTAIQH